MLEILTKIENEIQNAQIFNQNVTRGCVNFSRIFKSKPFNGRQLVAQGFWQSIQDSKH